MCNFKKILSFLVILLFLIPATTVFCRAGGGHGGGGGGHSSSGGSSSSHSSSSSGSGGTNSPFGLVITISMFTLAAFQHVNGKSSYKYKKKALSELKELSKENPTWNFTEIKEQIHHSFPLIQKAWMNNDYSKIMDLISSDLYTTHMTKLNWMRMRGEKNIIKEVDLRDITPMLIIESKHSRDDDFIWVKLKASMIDYTIKESDNSIIEGSKMPKSFEEYWKFIRKDDKWLADSIMQIDDIEDLTYFDKIKKQNTLEY